MVKIGVIGVGVMGKNHVRALSEIQKVTSIIISDVDKQKIGEIISKFDIAKTYNDYKEMLKNEKLDGVIISVPPTFHKRIVLDCIDAGVNVLVEKPISHDLEEAQEMIDEAKKKGIIFLVGHIERFNPVVSKIKELIEQGKLGEIYLVNTIRIGPFPKRLYGFQEGVLIDISVHDIDVIRYLAGEIKQVYSQLIFLGKQEVYARCLFELEKGIKSSSEFSWISPKRSRTIEIYGTRGMLRGDYFSQELTFYENNDSDTDAALTKGNVSAGNITNIPVNKQEPLKVELASFIDCIKNNKKPIISSEDAKRALEIALSVLESSKNNKPIEV